MKLMGAEKNLTSDCEAENEEEPIATLSAPFFGYTLSFIMTHLVSVLSVA